MNVLYLVHKDTNNVIYPALEILAGTIKKNNSYQSITGVKGGRDSRRGAELKESQRLRLKLLRAIYVLTVCSII